MSKNNKTGQRTRRQSKPTIIIVERHYEDNENNEKTETVWFHFSLMVPPRRSLRASWMSSAD